MNMPVFGTGKDKDEHFWNSLLRQMLLEDLLKKILKNMAFLKITKKGEAFLKKPTSFKIVIE